MDKLDIEVLTNKRENIRKLQSVRIINLCYILIYGFLAIFYSSSIMVVFLIPLVYGLYVEHLLLNKLRGMK